MTRLSPVDGIVVLRDVVPGNLYDTNDVLMVIAPLDHLIVWLNVYEADQAKVAMGQHMEIRFPYLNRTILGTVQYVATEVSKDTRTIRIRASIPNVNGELKADMLVRASLDIPPVNGPDGDPSLGGGRHERPRVCVRPQASDQFQGRRTVREAGARDRRRAFRPRRGRERSQSRRRGRIPWKLDPRSALRGSADGRDRYAVAMMRTDDHAVIFRFRIDPVTTVCTDQST